VELPAVAHNNDCVVAVEAVALPQWEVDSNSSGEAVGIPWLDEPPINDRALVGILLAFAAASVSIP
jgi:hypothetical protein